MPTFVPRTVSSFERTATAVARRVAAPVRMLATRALSFADRLVGTWAGASPMVGGLEAGARPTMLAAARGGGGGALPLPRPWYEVEADEDAIWPQQAARAALAAAQRATAASGAAPAAASTGATAAATTVPSAAERGAAIARTPVTAPPERTTRLAAAERAGARGDESAAGESRATAAVSATIAAATQADAADVRVAEALGLHAPVAQPVVMAPAARATTPLARALAHAAWVDQQLRTAAPVVPAARASAAGYVFIAPADAERAERAQPMAPRSATLPAARDERPAAAPAMISAAPVTTSPSVAAWSSLLPDPRLPATLPTPIARRVADFVSQLVGAQAARDAAPMRTATTTALEAPASVEMAGAPLPVRAGTPERTFVVLQAPAAVSWRPGAAAVRSEQLGARVDARVTAAWGEPTAAPVPMAIERALPAEAASATVRVVPSSERTWVAPAALPAAATVAQATGPARMSQFVQQLVGVQAARATAPLPVQALVTALERGEASSAAATTFATTSTAFTASTSSSKP